MEPQTASEIPAKIHYQPDHTRVNGDFSCPMGPEGQTEESSPVFDKVTCLRMPGDADRTDVGTDSPELNP